MKRWRHVKCRYTRARANKQDARQAAPVQGGTGDLRDREANRRSGSTNQQTKQRRGKLGIFGRLHAKLVLPIAVLAGMATTQLPAMAEPQGEMTIAIAPLLQRFDPINQVTTTDYLELSMVFDGLVNLGSEGIYPAIAESWKVSDDGLTIDVKIREGVNFTNGEPVTAEDVEFSYEGILDEKSTHGYRAIFAESIDDVEVVDTYHARFHMKKPWSSFFTSVRGSALQAIVPKAYYEKVGSAEFQKHPIGSGPYKFDKSVSGEWTRFEANKDYWRQTPDIKYITLKLVNEPFTRLAQVLSGEADVAAGITGPLLKRAKDEKLDIVYARYNGTNALHFDRDSNPLFKDKRVRLAIAHAINREAMASSILDGVCEPSTQYFTPATFGYDPDIKPITYDPELAKKLLAETDFKPGYESDFMFHTGSFASSPNGPQMQEAIVGTLEGLGFKLTRKNFDTASWLRTMRAEEFSGIFYGTSTAPKDGGGLMASYFLSNSYASNSQIRVPEYDEIYNKQLVEPNPEKRLELLHRFTKMERENVEAIPLFWCHYPFVLGAKVSEFKPGLGSAYHLNVIEAKLKR